MTVIIFKGQLEDVQFAYKILDLMNFSGKTIVAANSVRDMEPALNLQAVPSLIFIPDYQVSREFLKTSKKIIDQYPVVYKKEREKFHTKGGYAVLDEKDFLSAPKKIVSGFKDCANSLMNKTDEKKPETYRCRFLIRVSDRFSAIETEHIAYFFTRNRVLHICTRDNKKIMVDYSIEEVTNSLPPLEFFRVNRSMVVSFKSIKEIKLHSPNRLLLTLCPHCEEEVFVSRERLPAFKKWLGL